MKFVDPGGVVPSKNGKRGLPGAVIAANELDTTSQIRSKLDIPLSAEYLSQIDCWEKAPPHNKPITNKEMSIFIVHRNKTECQNVKMFKAVKPNLLRILIELGELEFSSRLTENDHISTISIISTNAASPKSE